MSDREDGQLCADAEPPGTDEGRLIPHQPPPTSADDPGAPPREGCRTHLRGWAGAHLHGAVRPRRRSATRGRPPGRWC